MAEFILFLPLLDKAEGGYQNKDSDKAGNTNSEGIMVGTNHGISAKIYEEYLDHPPTVQDMKEMTHEKAVEIYKDKYWDGMVHGDEIQRQEIANNIADMTINAGKPGIQLAHERLWLTGYPLDLPTENNELSTQAIYALNSMNEQQQIQFSNTYSRDRLDFYNDLAQDPRYSENLAGWENRVINNFPESKDLPGWNEDKLNNYYLTTEHIQYIVNDESWHSVDGKPGEATQQALQNWQDAHQLPPTGYLDEATKEGLQSAIMANETTHSLGDAKKDMGMLRDFRFEKEFSINDTVQEHSATSIDTSLHQGISPVPASLENSKWDLHEPADFSNVQESGQIKDLPTVNFSNEKAMDHISVGFAESSGHHADNGVQESNAATPSVSSHTSSSNAVSEQGATAGGI